MSEHQYQSGQRVRTEGRFRASGAYADPTVVTVKLLNPRGGVTTKVYGVDTDVVRDASGRYHLDLTTGTIPGRWIYRYIGEGAVEATDEEAFRVLRPAIP